MDTYKALHTALLTYDTALTMSRELSFIWERKLRLGTLLYLMTRYCLLLYLVLNIVSFSWPESSVDRVSLKCWKFELSCVLILFISIFVHCSLTNIP
jgi:hypothetical protein